MKKTLIAIAAVAATSGALAQSTVTLYGRVDAWMGVNKGLLSTADQSRTTIGNGGLTSSRFGFRGTEDLGGGLKANFHLQGRFLADTGEQSTTNLMFQADSTVGLSGNFGAVRLGRMTNPMDDVNGLGISSNVFDSAFTPTGDVYGGSGGAGAQDNYDFSTRFSNSIRYDSPSFSGFSAAIQYGLGEDKTATQDSQDSLSLHLLYKSGPLAVAYGYQTQDISTGATTITDRTFNKIAVAYDFGVASVSGDYNTASQDNLFDSTGYSVGVNVPMGAFSFGIGYAAEEQENAAGATVRDSSGWGLGVKYSLSKRTTLYAGYKNTKNKGAAGQAITGDIDKNTLTAVGIRHDF